MDKRRPTPPSSRGGGSRSRGTGNNLESRGSAGVIRNRSVELTPDTRLVGGIPRHAVERVDRGYEDLCERLNFRFRSEVGIRAAREALCHSSVEGLPEGNLKLARLGEAMLKANGVHQLYLAGTATGPDVSRMDTTRFTIKNLSEKSMEMQLQPLVIVGGSKPTVSSKMAAQILQAVLAAVFLDRGYDYFNDFVRAIEL